LCVYVTRINDMLQVQQQVTYMYVLLMLKKSMRMNHFDFTCCCVSSTSLTRGTLTAVQHLHISLRYEQVTYTRNYDSNMSLTHSAITSTSSSMTLKF